MDIDQKYDILLKRIQKYKNEQENFEAMDRILSSVYDSSIHISINNRSTVIHVNSGGHAFIVDALEKISKMYSDNVSSLKEAIFDNYEERE